MENKNINNWQDRATLVKNLSGSFSEPSFKYGRNMAMIKSDITVPTALLKSNFLVEPKPFFDFGLVAEESKKDLVSTKKFPKVLDRIATFLKVPSDKVWVDHENEVVTPEIFYIPENFKSDQPVKLDLKIINSGRGTLILIAGRGSEINVVLTVSSLAKVATLELSVILEESAQVNLDSLIKSRADSSIYTWLNVVALKDSRFKSIDILSGGGYNQRRIDLVLAGVAAETEYNFMCLGTAKAQIDAAVNIVHTASATTSKIFGRHLANDNSRIISRPQILIKPTAVQANAYQNERILMLTKNASAATVPILEIQNFDSKASHSSATTMIDKDKMFYLLSRGLDQVSAGDIFIASFLAPIKNKIKFFSSQEYYEL